MPEPSRAGAAPLPHPFAWRCLAAAALCAALVFAWHVAHRLFYPYDLEWMEGAMVDHAARVREGLGLYVPPGPDHVQFLYTPLFFQLGAALSLLLGDGYLPLRLVSLLASLACAALVGDWVRRETGRRLPGLAAAGLFLGGYGYLHSWYDLARNDTLVLALLLGTAMLLRFAGRRAALAAALAATLAFLAKQTALMWLPALAVGALLLDWRKGALFAAATAALIAATVCGYDLATDGWFSFFVFEMPRHHGVQGDRWTGFFTDDLVPVLPLLAGSLACCAARWREGRRGEAWFLAAFGGGGLATSYLSRLHAGGFDNVLMYGFAAGCVLAPAFAARTGPGRARCVGLLAFALQFALLFWDPRSLWLQRPALPLDGRRFLPSAAERAANDALLAYLRARPGDAFLPFQGHFAAMAGKPRTAHAQAMYDLLQLLGGRPFAAVQERGDGGLSPRARRALQSLFDGFDAALTARRFSTIVLEQPHGPALEAVFAASLGGYQRAPAPPIPQPDDLQPPVGMVTHSPYALLPRP